MKHLKLFESFEDIDSICKKYNIKNYTINSDGLIDVRGSVDLRSRGLTKIPLRFGLVTGFFDCSSNRLTSLEGSPECVYDRFYCIENKLSNLIGAPKRVDGNFYCNDNQLITLEGSPEVISGNFYCHNNPLKTLEGAPREVGGHFFAGKIMDIYNLFRGYKEFLDSLDWDYIRGNNIVRSRFEEACAEAGIEVPESIGGYEYI